MCSCNSNSDAVICLRPHHGMCLAFFEGKGYSEGFTAHMRKMLNLLAGEDGKDGVNSPVQVCLVTHPDAICAACPDNTYECCREEARVLAFDQGVLTLCGLKNGDQLTFGAFARRVQSQILAAGKRQEICGGCQWEDICANHASRWEDKAPKQATEKEITD